MREHRKKVGPVPVAGRMVCGILIILVLVTMLGGCAKFQSSRKLDIGPFGENAVSLMGDIQSVMTVKRPFYIKPYLQGQNIVDYRKTWDSLQKVLRGTVIYSTQIVSIAHSQLTEQRKAEEVALVVDQLLSPVVGSKDSGIKVTREELDKVLASIRTKTNLLDMLGAAQPMVDAVVNFTDASFEIQKDLLQALTQEVRDRMDERWGDLRENLVQLKDIQQRSLRSYALLYRYREGETDAYGTLLKSDPALKQYLPAGGAPGVKELDAAENRLMTRLNNLERIQIQLTPQVERYQNETRELDDITRLHQDVARKVRTSIIIWSRTHRNMSAGIPVPPEIDLYSMLTGAATQAAGKASKLVGL